MDPPISHNQSLSSDTRGGAAGRAVLDDGIGASSCEEIAVLVDGMEDIGTGIRLVQVGCIVGSLTTLSMTLLTEGDPTAPGDA